MLAGPAPVQQSPGRFAASRNARARLRTVTAANASNLHTYPDLRDCMAAFTALLQPPCWCCMGMEAYLVSRRRPQRGFSLLELLVVVSILIVAFLVFATFLGPGATGPAIERNARSVRALVAGIRQSSS